MTPRNPARFRLAGRALALVAGTVLSASMAFAQAPADPAAPAPATPAAPLQSGPPDPNTVLAIVNGEEITEGDVTIAGYELGAMLESVPLAQRKGAALNALITLKLLADHAATVGLEETADYDRRMAFYRKQALRDEFVTQRIIGAVDDTMIRSCYDNLIAGVTTQEEVRASHILVATEQEAIDIIAQLRAGGDFAALAAQYSTDTATKGNGGDLGFFSEGQMVEPFGATAFALEPGAITEQPVQTEYGWHVIRAEDRRTTPPPPFDQVEDQVRQIVYGDLYGAWIDALTATASIVDPNAPTPAPEAPAAAGPVEINPLEAVECLRVADATPVAPAPAPEPAPAPAAPAPAEPAAPAPAPAP